VILASTLPVSACNAQDGNPSSPTSIANETIRGSISNLARGGSQGLDVQFRIDDFTIVKARAGTPVISGSSTEHTDALLNGQRITVEGRRNNAFFDATRITIDAR
jgi:hypothetical protein